MARISPLPWNTLKWFSQNQVICSCTWRGEYTARNRWRWAASRASRFISCCQALRAACLAASSGSALAAWRCCTMSATSSATGRCEIVIALICACTGPGSVGGADDGRSCASSQACVELRDKAATAGPLAPQVKRVAVCSAVAGSLGVRTAAQPLTKTRPSTPPSHRPRWPRLRDKPATPGQRALRKGSVESEGFIRRVFSQPACSKPMLTTPVRLPRMADVYTFMPTSAPLHPGPRQPRPRYRARWMMIFCTSLVPS